MAVELNLNFFKFGIFLIVFITSVTMVGSSILSYYP